MPISTSEIIQPTTISTSDPAQFYGESVVTYKGEGGTTGTPISGTYYPFPVKPVASPVTVSAPAQQEATQLQTDIQKAQIAPPISPDLTRIQDLGKQQESLLGTRRTQLEQRRTAQQQAIEADFVRQGEELQRSQAKRAGTATSTIARLGGFLGESGSGQAYLQNLQLRHDQEIRDLATKKQMALIAAENAYNESDFALAKEQLNIARQTESDIYNRTQNFQNQQIKTREAQAKAQQAEQKAQQDAVTFALKQGINKPYYSVDGQNIVDTRTGQLVDPTQVDPTAEVQIIKKQPEPSDFMVVDLADGKYLMNKLTGEKQFIGELEADIKQVSVDNRVKLVNMKTGETVADLGAVSRAPRGGGIAKVGTTGMTSSQAQQAEIKIETEAKGLKRELEEGKTTWGDAWNYMYDTYSSYLEAAYPDEDINAMIDEMLGGTEFRDELWEKEEESSKTWWNPFD